MLLLRDNPLIVLTVEDINQYKNILKKELNNNFIVDNIRLMKKNNFNIIENCKTKKMEISGGNIYNVKGDISTSNSLFFRNFLSLGN